MQRPPGSAKDWLKAGGALGAAILVSRFTRMPLASVLRAMPFLIPEMRAAEGPPPTGMPTAAMTAEEARLILGVAAGADAQTIREAHRRLIQKNHPDLGGSDYLAAKINQARDILLK